MDDDDETSPSLKDIVYMYGCLTLTHMFNT